MTLAEFQLIISRGPTVVKFGASWCEPCKAMDKILARVTGAKILSVDVQASPELANAYGVMTLPTTIIFRSGAPVGAFTGLVDIHKIEELLRRE